MTGVLDRLRSECPVVQAGMGGGLAGASLAGAVAEAGGLGTIGILPHASLRDELRRARELTAGPIAVNLIVPLAGRAHWRVAGDADAVVTHWERRPRRRTGGIWVHTVGSEDEGRAAVAAGVDAVIAQGVDAGGHTRGAVPALELLERVLGSVPSGFPVLVAGGIADRSDVGTALDAGAIGAVAGTRFLAGEESGAHPGYKRRLVEGEETILTELFGMGWPRAPHRVLPNRATQRWVGSDGRVPAALGALHSVLSPVARALPDIVQLRISSRPSASPLDLAPPAPTVEMPTAALETSPLYAGETVSRISDVRPAAEIVRDLVP